MLYRYLVSANLAAMAVGAVASPPPETRAASSNEERLLPWHEPHSLDPNVKTLDPERLYGSRRYCERMAWDISPKGQKPIRAYDDVQACLNGRLHPDGHASVVAPPEELVQTAAAPPEAFQKRPFYEKDDKRCKMVMSESDVVERCLGTKRFCAWELWNRFNETQYQSKKACWDARDIPPNTETPVEFQETVTDKLQGHPVGASPRQAGVQYDNDIACSKAHDNSDNSWSSVLKAWISEKQRHPRWGAADNRFFRKCRTSLLHHPSKSRVMPWYQVMWRKCMGWGQ